MNVFFFNYCETSQKEDDTQDVMYTLTIDFIIIAL